MAPHTDIERNVGPIDDVAPKPDAPQRHFHRPPEAHSDDVEQSCITATDPMIVARAVHSLCDGRTKRIRWST
ncbi:hypothetical protein [Halobellus sp. H-GB7]|uniref:hypothetical protein n=1 Tax=Halobellus sp. H-GB7 TaxID=3069756 RepID=UPI0027B1E846|nr:hypothetical protein [Halobellus sp. H-GB7]MDQ2056353.1 hypothetical protein [Halobellus sp. H-GB7]